MYTLYIYKAKLLWCLTLFWLLGLQAFGSIWNWYNIRNKNARILNTLNWIMMKKIATNWRTCLPSRVWGPEDNTISTQLGSLNLTKPNPRDLPVVGFFMTTQSITSPYRLKYFSIVAAHIRQTISNTGSVSV